MSPIEITRLLLIPIVAALGYAMVDMLEDWSRFVVLGGIVLTATGTMAAISPVRRN